MGKMFIIPIVMSFIACTSVQQTLNPNTFYKRDISLKINGYQGEGTLVVPKASIYNFEIEAKGNLDLFSFETCHREDDKENAGDNGIFGNKRKVKLSYTPVYGIEDVGSCVVRLGGYEKDKGRHSWAMVDFEDPGTTLPALVKCNGNSYNANGVSICQSKQGLLEQIEFPVETIVNPEPQCPMPRPGDLKIYRFIMPPRECVYAFMEKAGAHREHRLTTIGYESVLVRSN